MSIQELITLLQNRLTFNSIQRAAALSRGDAAMVENLDKDTTNTQATLDQLLTLV
jgi:hypothetical protein